MMWERAGGGCSCWVNPNPFTHHGAVEPGDALEPDPRCKAHFPRWQLACINWSSDSSVPHAVVYCLVNGEAHAERFFPSWADAVGWLDRNGAELERWAKHLAVNAAVGDLDVRVANPALFAAADDLAESYLAGDGSAGGGVRSRASRFRAEVRARVLAGMCDADIAAALGRLPEAVAVARRAVGLPANRRFPRREVRDVG